LNQGALFNIIYNYGLYIIIGGLFMKRKILLPTILASLLLTGCGKPEAPKPTAIRLSDEDYRVTFNAAREAIGVKDMPSTGVAKVLVLPVDFEDFPAEDLPGGAENYLNYLEQSFFGDSEDTTWESLKSFYAKSSYGKVTIEGSVEPWYRHPKTAVQLGADARENGAGAAAANTVNRWAINEQIAGRNFSEFDGDADGLIDAIFMIYSAPFFAKNPNTGQAINNDLFWAFRSSTANSPDPGDPMPSNYMWASQEFMFDAGYRDELGQLQHWTTEELAAGTAKTDNHTFIHETGHMMGLDDYYSYDRASGDFGGLGGLDMMDYNVGDHNGYSKWMLGWFHPQLIVSEGEVTLKPIATNGDALVIPANWTGNVNSEYLLIDYYTPENLFKYDSDFSYSGAYPQFYSIPGVRVFHVDSRTGYVQINGPGDYSFSNYVDNVGPMTSSGFYAIIAANSVSRTFHTDSTMKKWKLIQMLERDGQNRLEGSMAIATDDMLFQAGDTFGVTTFADWKFRGGQEVPFKFEITSMNAEGVTIKFFK
jgi:M6 family metalloprotease-like protein